MHKTIAKITEKYQQSGHRTQLLIKNIVASFGIKAWSLLVQLLLVPVTLNCLTVYEYGIWLTLNSVMLWMDNFDIGLGNGLRNKLAEAIAKDDRLLARQLISTAVISLSALAVIIYIVLAIIVQTQDLYSLLNVEANAVPNLHLVIQMLCITICITFVAKLIGNIFLALQLPALNNLMASIASTLSLLFIWLLSVNGIKDFMLVCLTFTLMPLISYYGFSLYAFKFRYKFLCPSFMYFKKELVKSLMNLGIKFFIGQLSGMLLMSTANIVISKALTPAEVTPYQIAYRYFTMLIIVFTLISSPIWSSTTDAYSRGDMKWISSTLKKLEYIVAGSFVLLVIMLMVSKWFYLLWVGDKVSVDFSLSASVALYAFILLVSMCYSNIIYGIGKMNLTVVTVCIMSLIFIFSAYPVTKHYGVRGMVILQSVVTLVCTLQNLIQCKLLLAGKAHGIFNQ